MKQNDYSWGNWAGNYSGYGNLRDAKPSSDHLTTCNNNNIAIRSSNGMSLGEDRRCFIPPESLRAETLGSWGTGKRVP